VSIPDVSQANRSAGKPNGRVLTPHGRIWLAAQQWPLWFTALCQFVGYLILAAWFPLYPNVHHNRLYDIFSLSPRFAAGLAYLLLVISLFALHWLAYRQLQQKVIPVTWILAGAVLFALPLLFTYPINATDVYRYFLGGRITAIYQQSPLETAPAAFADDPYMSLAGEWINDTSPYGPVWETAAAALVWASGATLFPGLVFFKALGAIVHLLSAILIAALLIGRDARTRNGRVLLWAWNPALLLTFVVNAHNDSLMLFWLLLGFWLQQRGRPGWGLVVMTLAPLTKAIALLALPFFWLATWQVLPDYRQKFRVLGAAGIVSLTLAFLTFLPFGSPFELAERLRQEAQSGGGFSPSVLLILLLRRLGFNSSVATINDAATLLFVFVILGLLWWAWRGRSPLSGTADIFAAYLAQALRFRIWYATWVLPWLLLENSEPGQARVSFRLYAALWLLLTSQLSVVIYGHLRIYLFNGDHFWAHLVGVPFTLGLPLLAAFLASSYNPR
jgi:hypothetical protein